MKRFIFVLLLPLLVFAGCGMEQSTDSSDTAVSTETPYSSDISAEDCYLCGGGTESPLSPYWGQNNIALFSLNTFDIKPLEINRYDKTDEQLIEEYAGMKRNLDRTCIFPRGCAGTGDRWEPKATPQGVFNRT